MALVVSREDTERVRQTIVSPQYHFLGFASSAYGDRSN
jgi:hypothetical protein